MENPLNKIYETLQTLTGLHRQLLETVRVERTAIIDADLRAIHQITATKQDLVEKIRLTENERLKFTTELAVLWKKPLRDLTLPNIIIAIQGEDSKGADQLRSIHNTLTVLIQRITDQNSNNLVLIERSLEHVNAMKKNVLGESAPASGTYTQSGQKTSSSSSSRLFSGEA